MTAGNKNAQKGDEPASSFLHIRLTPAQKSAYVKAAQREGKKLSEWVTDTLGKASA